ncbi:MAG: MFS transporter, partial [Dehalococcoidia bacterium]
MNPASRPARLPQPAGLFYGWYMVAACAVVAFYAWGLGFYGLGVYLNVFHRQYGWSVGFISLTVTGYYLAGAAAVIPIGSIIDRRGPRGVIVYGCLAMGAGVAALGFVSARWQLIAVYLVMSTGWASMSTTAISSTLLPWFNRRRGRALTLALCGASLGGMALVPLLVALTQAYGFRVATSLAALLLWASVLPLALFVVKRGPQDLGLLPDG